MKIRRISTEVIVCGLGEAAYASYVREALHSVYHGQLPMSAVLLRAPS